MTRLAPGRRHAQSAYLTYLAPSIRSSDIDAGIRADYDYPVLSCRRLSNVIQGEVTFAEIPHDHWFQPDWIDEDRARAGREKMVADNIIYGGSVSYRNMCRFNSGVLAGPLLVFCESR